MTPKENLNKKGPENSGDIENQEAFLDMLVEAIIVSPAAKKINEGAEGVILGVDLDYLDAELKNSFIEAIPEMKSGLGFAVKTLKINIKPIVQEANNQKEAFALTEELARTQDSDNFRVKVPYVYKAKTITLSSAEAIAKLAETGVHISKKVPSLNYMIMDLVVGDDLETWAAKKLIELNEELFYEHYGRGTYSLAAELAKLNNESVKDLVKAIFAEAPIQDQDAFRVFLRKKLEFSGLLGEEDIEQLRKTLEFWHSKGFYHRDIHQRNIMIGDDNRLYLLDFAQAVRIDSTDRETAGNIYRRSDTSFYLQDLAILEWMSALAKTEEDKDKVFNEYNNSLLGEANGLKKRSKRILEGLSGVEPSKFVAAYLFRINNFDGFELDYNYRLAALSYLAEDKGMASEVMAYCEQTISERKEQTRAVRGFQALLDLLTVKNKNRS